MEPPALKLIQGWKVDEPLEPPCHVAVPLAHELVTKNQSSTSCDGLDVADGHHLRKLPRGVHR